MLDGLTIALVGNPNTGKTTLFNLLTGKRERTGNWTGVTVDTAQAVFKLKGRIFCVTDLPGIYSFSPDSQDERVARNYLINQKPAVIVNLVDASNLERSLYLTAQLLDMRLPLVVVLNQIDIAERYGVQVDAAHLSQHLGCPVIPIVASKGQGIDALKQAICQVAESRVQPTTCVQYSDAEPSVRRLQVCLIVAADDANVDSRWLAIKLLERDPFARELTQGVFDAIVNEECERIARHTGQKPEDAVMDARIGFIRGLARDVIKRQRVSKRHLSDLLDRILLSRPLGIPLFLCVMYVVFWLTVRVTQPLVDFADQALNALLVTGPRLWLTQLSAPKLVTSLLCDGLGAGLTTVATFMPPIFMIFLCLSLLEESGYMARAAFIMDRFLNRIGLPGKAFIPLLVGFGCTVPALLATRTLEQRRDRLLTMLIAPFMSCGARMPVYAIFAMAFFPKRGTTVIFSLYLTGAILAILSGLLLHRTLFKGNASAFVMELPPYHIPALRGCLEHVWANLKSFLIRAGQVILVIAIFLSLANTLFEQAYPTPEEAFAQRSAAGKSLTVAFRPMGVTADNWPAAAGLLTGLMAKEAIIGTLEVLYSHTDEQSSPSEESFDLGAELRAAGNSLIAGYTRPVRPEQTNTTHALKNEQVASLLSTLRRNFGSPTAAYAYLLFVLIYSPCIAALIVLGREAGWRWMGFAITYQTLLAWMVATAYYQLATFASAPMRALGWLSVVGALFLAGVQLLAYFGKRMPHEA